MLLFFSGLLTGLILGFVWNKIQRKKRAREGLEQLKENLQKMKIQKDILDYIDGVLKNTKFDWIQ